MKMAAHLRTSGGSSARYNSTNTPTHSVFPPPHARTACPTGPCVSAYLAAARTLGSRRHVAHREPHVVPCSHSRLPGRKGLWDSEAHVTLRRARPADADAETARRPADQSRALTQRRCQRKSFSTARSACAPSCTALPTWSSSSSSPGSSSGVGDLGQVSSPPPRGVTHSGVRPSQVGGRAGSSSGCVLKHEPLTSPKCLPEHGDGRRGPDTYDPRPLGLRIEPCKRGLDLLRLHGAVAERVPRGRGIADEAARPRERQRRRRRRKRKRRHCGGRHLRVHSLSYGSRRRLSLLESWRGARTLHQGTHMRSPRSFSPASSPVQIACVAGLGCTPRSVASCTARAGSRTAGSAGSEGGTWSRRNTLSVRAHGVRPTIIRGMAL